MALPKEVRTGVESVMQEYCAKKIPLQHRDKIRMSFGIQGNSMTLYEERHPGTKKANGRRWLLLSSATARTVCGRCIEQTIIANGMSMTT